MRRTYISIKIGDREEYLPLDRERIEKEISLLKEDLNLRETVLQHLDALKEAHKEARHRLRYLRTGGRKYLTLILHPDGSVQAKVDVVKRTEETFTLQGGKWVKVE